MNNANHANHPNHTDTVKQADWMKDPLLSGIESYKLEFLQTLVFESSNLSQKQMLPFLMAVAKRSQNQNVVFSDEEMETIITVLKNHASPAELEKMNKVMEMRKARK